MHAALLHAPHGGLRIEADCSTVRGLPLRPGLARVARGALTPCAEQHASEFGLSHSCAAAS
eukprot:13654704-Alexandrium_andersonii.AAC.1